MLSSDLFSCHESRKDFASSHQLVVAELEFHPVSSYQWVFKLFHWSEDHPLRSGVCD